MFGLLALPPAVVALKTAVAKHLCLAVPVLHARLERFAANLAESLAVDALQALNQIAALPVRDVCMLLAEGPSEQARAAMLPLEVHPVEHGGLDGHVEAKDAPLADATPDISAEMSADVPEA